MKVSSRKFVLKLLMSIMLSACFWPAAYGIHVGYRTPRLESIVNALKTPIDSVSADTTLISSFRKHPVRIDIRNGVVVHAGYEFFSDTLRNAIPFRKALDFVERYALETDIPSVRRNSRASMMREDNVLSLDVNMEGLHAAAADTTLAFIASVVNNRKYCLEWRRDDNLVYFIEFPVDYSLLAGRDMIENESALAADLQSLIDSISLREQLSPKREELISMMIRGYYVKPGKSYLIDNLTTNTYFGITKPDSVFSLISSNSRPLETLSNIIVTGAVPNDINVDLKINGYNELPKVGKRLSVLVDYFVEEGCTPYFGVGDIDDDMVARCYVMLDNPFEGYCHLLQLSFDTQSEDVTSGTLKGRLTPFIPMAKVANLFDDDPSPQ